MKAKNDPKLVAAARELRDRYLEQVNSERLLPAANGKYDVSRQLHAPATETKQTRRLLTAAEQHLVKSLPAEKGRDLLKQVRTHLIETARPVMEAMLQELTGVKVLSVHHDISTTTGEEVVLFTLAESPAFREGKKK